MKNILSLLFVFAVIQLAGQTNDNSWKAVNRDGSNFYTIKNQFDSYLQQEYPDSIPKSKLSNIKDYYRTINFWKSRLSIDNDAVSSLPYIESINTFMSQSYCTGTDPANWELVGPSNFPASQQVNGLVTQVLNDPNNPNSYLLSSDYAGIWKNQTSGNTWHNVTDNLHMPGLACSQMIRNPFNPNHIIASTFGGAHFIGMGYGQGLIESFDNGNTWSIMNGFPHQNYPSIEKVIADPNDNNPGDGLTLYAIGDQTLYKSTNTGLAWTVITNLPTINQFTWMSDIEIANNGDMYLTLLSYYSATDGQIFRCHNNTWTDISNLLPNFQRMQLSNPYNGKIFAIVDVPSGSIQVRKIYKTLDYGATWTFVTSGGGLSPGFKKEIEYSPTSGIVYVGDITLICFNENNPVNKISFYPGHMDIRDIVFMETDANGFENTLVATDGGISNVKVKVQNISDYSYTNLNGNFLPIEEFMGLGVCKGSSEIIVAGAVHNSSFKLESGTWSQFGCGDGGDCEINWDNPDIYYSQCNNWMSNSTGTFNYSGTTPHDWYIGMEYELNPNDPYIMYTGRAKEGNNLAKLLIFNEHGGNNGTGLLTIKNAPSDVSKIGAIGVNKNERIFIADWDGNSGTTPYRFAKSPNGGETWIDLSNKSVFKKSGNSWVLYGSLGNVLAWKSVEDIIFNPSDINEMWISIGAMSPGNATGFMRVLHSTDDGETWYDYSENLPPFPVMALEYQLGSNNRLFAGTDAGVYYRDPIMGQWECFSKNLPVCIVTDLDYDPCSKYLYVSTRGRSIFKTLVPFNDNVTLTLPANSNITWDKPVQLATNLIVPANTKLTITSSVYVSKDKKIIIQPSGKLIVNGGKITNQCGNKWSGIEVWGNASANQWPNANGQYQQGYLELNNAVIENAISAVELWSPGNVTKSGGIVKATNTTFRNNNMAVRALYYKNHHPIYTTVEMDYNASFSNCIFEITPAFTGSFYRHIDLDRVKGVKFNGCDFILADGVAGVQAANYGIYSRDAGFNVNAICNSNTVPCSSYDKCNFTGFYKAVSATRADINNYTFSINNAVFSSNTIGVYVNNVKNQTIINSSFAIGNNHSYCSNAQGYGIYLDYSTGFAIEENNFTKSPTAPVAIYYGLNINETKAVDEVYKNNFTGLSYANYSTGKNFLDITAYQGLAYYCNINADNWADFYVAPSNGLPAGIQLSQGDDAHVTGNTFSQNGSLWHFYNGVGLIGYYYCDSHPNENPDDAKIFQVTDKGKPLVNQCPSHYGDPTQSIVMSSQQRQETEQQFANNLTNYNNVKSLYDNLVDGGSTDGTMVDIATAVPSDMWALRSELLGKSPHLSMKVLMEAADKTDVFTESALFDILAANPDELKREELLKYLEDKENPLPAYIIDILRQVATGITYKTVLQQQMALYSQGKSRDAHNMIRCILNDTVLDFTALRNWLDNLGGIRADEQIIASYLEEGNYSAALSLANTLPEFYDLTGTDLTEHGYYMGMLNLMVSLEEAGRSSSDLTSAEVDILNAIAAASTGVAGAEAKSILEANYAQQFVNCPAMAGSASYKSSNVKTDALGKVYHVSITVKPNPANEWAAFDYTLPDIGSVATITIVNASGTTVETLNISGKQGQKLWDTRKIETGIYLYTLKVDGFNRTGKIVISK